jgi:hypothetical protein
MDDLFKRAAQAFGKNDHKRVSKPYIPPTAEQEKEDVDDVWRDEKGPKKPRAKLIWQVRAEKRSQSNNKGTSSRL